MYGINYDVSKMLKVYGMPDLDLSLPKPIPTGNRESSVYLICDYCSKSYTLSINNLKKRVARLKLPIRHSCHSQVCVSKRKTDVAKLALPHTFPREISRKGKSFIDLYGEEKAVIVKQKLRDLRKSQICPRSGKTHSEEAKQKMSKSRLRYISSSPQLLSPITKTLVSYSIYRSHVTINASNNRSAEEKDKLRKNASLRYLNFKRYSSHSRIFNVKDYYGNDVICESTYEVVYAWMLINSKVRWKKNNAITIPYIHPFKGSTYYIPDFLLYKNKKLSQIIEVKPHQFLTGVDNYSLITQAKLIALEKFCLTNNLQYKVITEIDLNDKEIQECIGKYENYKKDFEQISARKKRILRKCE